MCAALSRILVLAWVLASLESCYRHRPDTVSICGKPEFAFGWNCHAYDAIGSAQCDKRVGTTAYIVDVSASLIRADGGAADGYWIKLGGSAYGRQATPPMPALPLLYQPDGVWIEVNGKRTAASGEVRYDHPDTGSNLGKEPVALPVDLNSSDPLKRQIYIAFPIRRPQLHDHWTLHLGAIKQGDEAVPIPEFQSCLHPGGVESAPPWQG